jgi:hypothetical protein
MLEIIPNAPAARLKTSTTIHTATTASAHVTFTNANLPLGTQALFHDVLTPMWQDYNGTLENPWEASTAETTAYELQVIWDLVFPKIEHVMAIHDDPVYTLVCLHFIA